MERDVEMRLATQLAALEATISGFRLDVSRRMDDQNSTLAEIERQVRATNGRVTALETVNAARLAGERAAQQPRPLKLTDLKLLVSVALGSGTFAITVVLWILKVAGKL